MRSSPPIRHGATSETPARLRLIDRIYTGQPSAVTVVPGTCAEIATGAPLPAGADAVVMVEETATEGEQIHIRVAAAPGQNVGRRGADIMTGDLVVREGDVLTPSRIGALAAIGCTEVDGLREAARRDSVDGQRSRRARTAAQSRTNLRRQPIHAGRDRRRPRRRAAIAEGGDGHARVALGRARRVRRIGPHRLFRRQLGRRRAILSSISWPHAAR